MPKLNAGWWLFIAAFLVFELLATLFLDYTNDPMASIILIHGFPIVGILSILIWGRNK